MDYYEEVKTTLLGYLKDAQRAAMNNDLNHFRELDALGLCDYVEIRSKEKPLAHSVLIDVIDIYTMEKGLQEGFPVEGGSKAFYGYSEGLKYLPDHFWDTSTPYGKARLDFVTDFIKYVEDFNVSELKDE